MYNFSHVCGKLILFGVKLNNYFRQYRFIYKVFSSNKVFSSKATLNVYITFGCSSEGGTPLIELNFLDI